jgi:hypothetical protein
MIGVREGHVVALAEKMIAGNRIGASAIVAVAAQVFDIGRKGGGRLDCNVRRRQGTAEAGGVDPPRIRLDLTADDVLVRPPVLRPVGHLYTDAPPDGTKVDEPVRIDGYSSGEEFVFSRMGRGYRISSTSVA